MTSKRIIFGIAMIALIFTAGVIAVEAGQGKKFNKKNSVISKSLMDNDFEAWKKAMQNKTKIDASKLTQESFKKLQEVSKLWKDGKKKEAIELKKGLDLGLGNGHLRKMKKWGHYKKMGAWIKKFKTEGIKDKNGDGICNATDLKEDPKTN
tara:strand:+ start:236 stop:688 length:453 start_codon:yes stop_codon:yes gene_type:complete